MDKYGKLAVAGLSLQLILAIVGMYIKFRNKKENEKKFLLKQMGEVFKIKDEKIKISRLHNLITSIGRL